jgi:NAD(P)-dependent dehydrogenase (short-subunit alcohol dehydrogenase family)
MKNDSQRVALITGGNRGLGLQTARELAPLGITVLLGCRDREKGEAAAAKLRKEGLQAESVEIDVSDPKSYEDAYNYIEKTYGKLDILVNNAGVAKVPGAPPEYDWGNNCTSTLPLEVIRQTFDTNFFGTIALTQKFLPLVRKSPAGRIVNVSSILGSLTLHSDPSSPIYPSKLFAYNASKTAINAFTVHLAHELRDTKIKVNSAHPGWVKTDMGGEGAQMEVSEGGKTSAQLATLPEDGPTGGYFHLGKTLPW